MNESTLLGNYSFSCGRDIFNASSYVSERQVHTIVTYFKIGILFYLDINFAWG